MSIYCIVVKMYQVWYINTKGKHIMRKEHPSLISAARHSINLSDATELFSYVRDSDTGLIAREGKWITTDEAFYVEIDKNFVVAGRV